MSIYFQNAIIQHDQFSSVQTNWITNVGNPQVRGSKPRFDKYTFIEVAQWKRGGPILYLLPFAGGDDNSRRAETLLASGPDDATLGFCIGDSRPLGPPPTDEAISFFYWLDS